MKVQTPVVTISYIRTEMAAPTPQVDVKALAWEGARLIHSETLSLNPADRLLLFHDEQGVAIANLFGEVARALRLRYVARFVPREKQMSRAGQALPAEDAAAIDQADAVLICLGDDLRTTSYRRQLLECAALGERVAGLLSPALPALAHASRLRHEQAPERCGELARILLAGRSAEVTTAVLDARGDVIEEHCLSLSLGGFKRCPATAGGPIPAGTWAPLPMPEVSIAPEEESANGVFVLNGDFPGGAMPGHEHLLLVFASGRLEMVGGNSSRVGEFWKVVESAKSLGTPLSLSSIGIRLWDTVGTTNTRNLIQLGLGDNTALGGRLNSPIQETLLSRAGSLSVDGRTVLRNGSLVYEPAHWQESRATAQSLTASMSGELLIQLTQSHAHAGADGLLGVIRHVGQSRACSYILGDAGLSPRLSELYQVFTEHGKAITLSELSRLCLPGTMAADLTELRGLLGVLERHQLIEVRRTA